MAAKRRGRPGAEADGYMDTKLQYKDKQPPLPLQIDEKMMEKKVQDVKHELLQLDHLKNLASEQPSELGLFLVISDGERNQEGEILLKLDDDAVLKDYNTEIARAKMIKLLNVSEQAS